MLLIYVLTAWVLLELNPLAWCADVRMMVALLLFFLWFVVAAVLFERRCNNYSP